MAVDGTIVGSCQVRDAGVARIAAAMTERWVVVGAGSGGCVAAARLSEDQRHDVVLVEAGPALEAAAVPPAIDGADFLAAIDEPERVHSDLVASRRTGAQPIRYVRGRGVGGSSAINAMVALRGDPEQYRRWGWTDVDSAWARMALPEERPDVAELGVVDRALLAAAPDATLASLTRRHGRRVTAAEAYLWPAAHRPNLTIRADQPVDRVQLTGRRATGVVLGDGDVVPADRVVVAAGAIHSPAILLRSGIDNDHIGRGLQDHPSAPFTLQLRSGVAHDAAGLAVGSLLQRGVLQVLPMNHLGRSAPGLGLLMVALMRPTGHGGTVRLDETDHRADPVVDLALLDEAADVAALRTGVRMAIDLLASPPFQEIVEAVFIDASGTPVSALVDDDTIDRWMASSTGDYVHACGTCAMGAVVDDDGAVIGLDSLYVCDASVFPSIPDVNTHLPTTMLAERLNARWAAR